VDLNADEVTGFFDLPYPTNLFTIPRSSELLMEMNIRNLPEG
jgi:hypothetical protein